LDSDGQSWLDRFYPLYKEAEIVSSKEAFAPAFYASDDNLSRLHRLQGLSLEDTVALQVAGVLEQLAPQRLALGKSLADRFLTDCRVHFKRNRLILGRLRRQYKLGIVSNYYGNLDSCLRAEGLRDLFDSVADSEVTGVKKPDPGIFNIVLREMGVGAEDCFMVGDSIPRDMRGAEGLKMRHALLSCDPQARCCPQSRTLASLSELESCL